MHMDITQVCVFICICLPVLSPPQGSFCEEHCQNREYRLHAVCVHEGRSIASGHFLSYVLVSAWSFVWWFVLSFCCF